MGLIKSLEFLDLVFLGLGDIFGAGIFVLISQCIAYAGNKIYLVFLFITLLTIISGLSYGEIAGLYPKNTAEQQAIRDGIHPLAGNVANFLIYFYGVVTTSTILVSIGKYLEKNHSVSANILGNKLLSPLVKKYHAIEKRGSMNIIISTVLLIVMTVWTLSGIHVSKKVINTIMIVLLSIIIVLIVAGFTKRRIGGGNLRRLPKSSNFVLACILFIFLFDGFDSIVKMKEEVVDNANLPKAMILSIGISAIFYLLLIVLGLKWLSYGEITKSITYIPDLFHKIFGEYSYWIVLVFGLLVMLNTSFISYLASTRFMYGIAHDHYDYDANNANNDNEVNKNCDENKGNTKKMTWKQRISCWIQELNRYNVPWKTVLFTSFVVFLLNRKKNEVFLAFVTDISMIIILLLINLSVIALRIRKPDEERPFRIPGNIGNIPILPIVAIVVFVYMLYYSVKNKIWGVI
jgi:APA family basic amino acid/polyamine antiporter